jgi:hypothetical protein
MANHLRQQIREAAAALLTGLTTTGPRVYPSRVYPLAEGQLPALRIYATEESAAMLTIHAPKLLERRLTLVVECCAKAGADLDDVLDTMAKEVETALGNAPTLSSKAKDSVLTSTEIELIGDGDQPLGVARLSFEVMYATAANAPDTLS